MFFCDNTVKYWEMVFTDEAGKYRGAANGVQLGLDAAQMAQLARDYWGYMSTVYAQVVQRGAFAWQQLWTGQPKSTADLRAGSYPSGMQVG